MPKNPTVTVITATTGHAGLQRAIESVRDQRYARLEHIIAVDGPDWNDKADLVLNEVAHDRLQVVRLPFATGKAGWNGHRIYAALPYLARGEYVCWLDDDNWFDDDHLESLVQVAMRSTVPWAFSLRKIVDANGNLVALDQCESLGTLHPTFMDPRDFLVDTNCYLLKREVAMIMAPAWNRVARPTDGPSPDRVLCQGLMNRFPDAPSTKLYTVNYVAGNTPSSVSPDFFLQGNAVMRQRYPKGLPWE